MRALRGTDELLSIGWSVRVCDSRLHERICELPGHRMPPVFDVASHGGSEDRGAPGLGHPVGTLIADPDRSTLIDAKLVSLSRGSKGT